MPLEDHPRLHIVRLRLSLPRAQWPRAQSIARAIATELARHTEAVAAAGNRTVQGAAPRAGETPLQIGRRVAEHWRRPGGKR